MRRAQIETSFLKSRVARRIFLLFVLCAVLPLLVLSMFSFTFVSTQLEKQTTQKLRQTCKAKGLEIYEHLLFLETEMKMIASRIAEGKSKDGITFVPYPSDKGAGKRFRNLVLVHEDNSVKRLLGDIKPLPVLQPAQRAHLQEGRSLLLTRERKPNAAVYMARWVDPADPASVLVLAEINPIYLWGLGSQGSLPPEVDMVIQAQENHILITSLPSFEPSRHIPRKEEGIPCVKCFDFELDGKEYVASCWDLFIKPRFHVESWSIIVAESKSRFLAPAYSFKLFFSLILLLTFWTVALLNVILIRKSLVPIETLHAATKRIARGELGTRVDIRTKDEFETLGRSFNEMSHKLEEDQRLLVRSAKMSAFGQMAAGIVHEIGQPLTSLHGLIELTLDGPLDSEQREFLETAQKETKRLRDMLLTFKSFSRAPHGNQESLQVNEIIDETIRLLGHQLQMKGIQLSVEKEEGIPSVLGDRNGLQQVLANLVINAMDALVDRSEGEGHIEIRSYAQDDRACIRISDNGPGIPKEIRERIFDPFFTTKGEKKGTGLGLAVTQSILHRHQGRIHVSSTRDSGTRFLIELPAEHSEA